MRETLFCYRRKAVSLSERSLCQNRRRICSLTSFPASSGFAASFAVFSSPEDKNGSRQTIFPKAAVYEGISAILFLPRNTRSAIGNASGPLRRIMPIAPSPIPVAMAQMVAYENGACGRARVNGLHKSRPGNYMTIASYDGLRLKNVFCFSGWFCGEGYVIGTTPTRYISRKSNANDAGWEICCYNYNYAPNVLSGGAAGDANTNLVRFVSGLQKESWSYLTACYHGNSLSIYTNGVVAAVGNIDPVSDNGLELILGSGFRGWGPSFLGQYDEIRLRGGLLSAARIKADFDMIKNRNFLTYGPVESGRGAE